MTGAPYRAAGFFKRPRLAGLTVTRILLIGWFTANTATLLVNPIRDLFLGWDAIVYVHASRALLLGANPWTVNTMNIYYAAPPPSLLFGIPFVWMPDWLIAATWMALAAGSAIYILRRLSLPYWWLLFPPIALGVASGSSALPTLALLLVDREALRALAVPMRLYAALPLALLGQWRPLLLAAIVLVVTFPFLAWQTYLATSDFAAYALAGQSSNLSATAVPPLIPVAAIAILALGRRRAAWLVVPALWPLTNIYYGVMALPVLAELPLVTAALAGPPVPGFVVVGLVADAIRLRLAAAGATGRRRAQTSRFGPPPG